MEIKKLRPTFSVCQVTDFSLVHFDSEYCFVGKTDEECSLVCPTGEVPENTVQRDDGWNAFRIQGVLDFSLIGILAKIAAILAENAISIFAVSTYNTDYILVKSESYEKALAVLASAGNFILPDVIPDGLGGFLRDLGPHLLIAAAGVLPLLHNPIRVLVKDRRYSRGDCRTSRLGLLQLMGI